MFVVLNSSSFLPYCKAWE